MHRRQYLLAVGTAAIPLVAGCSDTESDGGSEGGSDGNSSENTESTNSGSENSSESEDGDNGSEDSEESQDISQRGAGEDVLENAGLVIQEHELVVEEEHGVEDVRVEGIVENTTDETKDYVEVAIRVYDADGHQLESYFTNTTDLQAGGTWKFEVMVMEESDEIEEYDIAVTDSAL